MRSIDPASFLWVAARISALYLPHLNSFLTGTPWVRVTPLINGPLQPSPLPNSWWQTWTHSPQVEGTQPSPQAFLREAERDLRSPAQESYPKNPVKKATTLRQLEVIAGLLAQLPAPPRSIYTPLWGKISALLWWPSRTHGSFPCMSASWPFLPSIVIYSRLKKNYLIIWCNDHSLASFLPGQMHLNIHHIWHCNTNTQGRTTTGVIHLW